MPPKAIFWDIDGTLIDSEPLHDAALIAALRDERIEPPDDLHDRVLGVAAFPVYEMLRDEFGLSLPFKQWIARKYSFYLAGVPQLKPRPGALEIWREADALSILQGVVSNSDRVVVGANIECLGISRHGLISIARNDVRNGKPDAEPYLRAAWLCGLDPADCAVMEDSPTGAAAGVAAGMTTVFWPQSPRPGPAGALVAGTDADVRALLGFG